MPVSPLSLKRLTDPVVLTTSWAAVYTAATGVTVRIDAIRLANTTGAGVACYVAISPSGGAISDDTHDLIPGAVCAANDVIDDNPKQVLTAGDKIYAKAGATGVVLTISGVVVGP